MSPQDAELLRETIVDYVNDERGTGFIVRGPLDEPEGCAGCGNIDTVIMTTETPAAMMAAATARGKRLRMQLIFI